MGKQKPNYEHIRYGKFTPGNSQHYKMLHLCREIGWTTVNPDTNQVVADIERLGAWIKKYGFLHKPLQKYDRIDVSKLITQFEKVVNHHLSTPKPCQKQQSK